MYDLEIMNAEIVTSTKRFKGSISVKNGKIAAISKFPLKNAKRYIDSDGLTLVPGMVDQHVHFMDPGETDREDFIYGSITAATGGVTTVVEHTHVFPVRGRSFVDFGLTAHVFPEDLGHLKALWEKGIMMTKYSHVQHTAYRQ